MEPIDPETYADYSRLKSSVDKSMTRKRSREIQRLKLLKRMVGPYFGDDGCQEKRPINMLELGVDIFQRNISSHQPQALVISDYEELAPTSADFQIVLNRRLDRIRLEESLNICAIEALFTIGVMCVGLAIDGIQDAGQVFAEPVLFPDLILDMQAKSWEQQSYIGHDFLVPVEWIKSSGLFSKSAAETFIRAHKARNRRNGRDWSGGADGEYVDMVQLRQLWLPHSRQIVICAPDGGGKLPLTSNEWDGPDRGPYHPLSFGVVPGHLFPRAPVPMWADLDDIINKNFTKAARQAARCKTVALTTSPDDAEVVRDLPDGDIGNVQSPQSIVEQTFGGANQQVLGMVNVAKQLLVYTGGNWDAIGGLAAQTDTVGQDQMLAAGAGGRMRDMQKYMVKFETGVIDDIGFWVWQDPLSQERFTKRLEGTDYSIESVWSHDTRKGEFFQLNTTVNPYSRITRSPGEQSQALTQFITQILMPALPYMQQEGPVDWEKFVNLYATYNHLPELKQIIRWPQGASEPGEMPETPGPSTTTRKYERINKSGGSGPSQNVDDAMSQLLSASSSQAPQAAQMQAV